MDRQRAFEPPQQVPAAHSSGGSMPQHNAPQPHPITTPTVDVLLLLGHSDISVMHGSFLLIEEKQPTAPNGRWQHQVALAAAGQTALWTRRDQFEACQKEEDSHDT
jgi:hypothetical protein